MLAKHFAVRTFVKALLRLDFILVFINYQFVNEPIKLLFMKFLFLLADQNLKSQLVSKLFYVTEKSWLSSACCLYENINPLPTKDMISHFFIL